MSGTPTGEIQAGRHDALIDLLVQTSFATTATLGRVAGTHDLSLTQLRVLAILRDRRVRMTALADYLGLEKSTLSGLIDRAAKRGLVRRDPNPDDGRVIDVLLTPAGAALAKAMEAEVEQALLPATASLSHADQERLRGLLRRMLDAGT